MLKKERRSHHETFGFNYRKVYTHLPVPKVTNSAGKEGITLDLSINFGAGVI